MIRPFFSFLASWRSLLQRSWQSAWGLWLFAGLSGVAWVKLLCQPLPGHYRIFTGAGRALWSGVNPHGTDYGTGVGYWFYSPSCGLFLFGPLSLLPEKLGLTAYTLVSWLVFVFGVQSFFSALTQKNPIGGHHFKECLQLFWLGIAPQMFTGILASKLEILTTGLLFWASSQMLRQRYLIVSAGVLGLIMNWKFQPLPSVALLMEAWVLLGFGLGLPLGVGTALLVWFALPWLFLDSSLVVSTYLAWQSTLTAFVQKAWPDFDHVFALCHQILGPSFLWSHLQELSLAFGGSGALFLLLSFYHWRSRKTRQMIFKDMTCLALATGAAFPVIFSPLSQNNGYILYAPLLLVALLLIRQEKTGPRKQGLQWLLGLLWGCLSFAYSDLVPLAVRIQARHFKIKPLACLLLLLLVWFASWQQPSYENQASPRNPT